MSVWTAHGNDSHSPINAVSSSNCVISLGSNVPGCWGAPEATLHRALHILEQNQVFIIARSLIYRTLPHPGAGLMPEFYNAVVLARTRLPPGGLLRLVKIIERKAGRRSRARWSARPLDLDIIDYGGRVLNWPALNRSGGPLVRRIRSCRSAASSSCPSRRFPPTGATRFWGSPPGPCCGGIRRSNAALRQLDSTGYSWH